ncbi:DNA-binding protein WhiA [Hominifimenecus sp. rT4P-3]|uniref:DNA-binding protein WhiA n=1 Tax=Hominifimenecus sp. rT4P-3 TaxID=3242979 RepID=UPI003DA2B10B
MSFSFSAKEELEKHMSNARHCRLAELAAIISACGRVSVRLDGRLFLVIQSESPMVARKAGMLLNCIFHLQPDVSVMGSGDWKKSRVYTLALRHHEDVSRVLQATKFLQENGVLRDLELPVDNRVIQSACCRRAFLRGAFLSSGSISNPQKSYHFEIVCANAGKAGQIQKAMISFDIDAKIVQRKKYHVVYVKESDGIVDLLNIMEAHVSLMELENIRILRGISGSVNRKVNCETANLNKTVSAAVEQVRDIRLIEEKQGLDSLPDNLREMAYIRLEYPDMPLKDLGNLLSPPVGKSGVNHRLRKLKAIAETLHD